MVQERKKDSKRTHSEGHSRPRPYASKKPDQIVPPISSNSISVNSLKSKIRDVSRLLNHSDKLPMDVRIEKERALAGYKLDLEAAQVEKQRQHIIKKYHMVRFFGQSSCKISNSLCLDTYADYFLHIVERKKAIRNLKRIKNRLNATTPTTQEHQDLQADFHIAEVNLNYTMYSPLAEKYLSLFPRDQAEEAEGETNSAGNDSCKAEMHRPAMWAVVEKSMRENTLEALRDRKPSNGLSSATSRQQSIPNGNSRKNNKNFKAPGTYDMDQSTVAEQNDESDEGFFEE